MASCKDCINFRSKDDLLGMCGASEDKLVEADRDAGDCIANSFQSKSEEEGPGEGV